MVRIAVARQRIVAIEFAEVPAERDVLFAIDTLPAEQQHAVLEEGAVHFPEF